MTHPASQPNRPRRRAAALIAGAVGLAASTGALLAASAGTRDAAFSPTGAGLNGAVTALALQPDGRIVVGGAFTAYDGTPRARIARLMPTGALDASFDPGSGLDGPVEAVALRAGGDILAAGAFSKADGQNRGGLAEFGAGGALDSGFDSGAGTGGVAARAVVSLPSGGAMLGGAFTSYGGISQTGIAEIRADGTLETGWFGYVGGPVPEVNTVVRRSDGAVIAGGAFTLAQTTARGRIALFDAAGTVDPSYASGAGFDGSVEALALQPDSKVLVGGQFTSYDGMSRPRIARLNADGSLDTAFAPGAGFDGSVEALALQPDGKVLVGGQFTSYDGTSRPRIARLNADGSLDTAFASGTGFDGTVEALAVQGDGGVLAGGAFSTFAGAAAPFVARLLGTATDDPVVPAPAAPPAASAPAPSPAASPQPEVGREGVARVVRGTVTVRLPGTDDFVSLERGVLEGLPVGSQVDTRSGVVAIRIREGGPAGPTRNVVVSRGVFTFQQNFRKGKPTLTDIRLSQPLACGASKSEAATGRRTRVARTRSRTVRVSVSKTKKRRKRGVVRTRSRYITGTARGTSWSASDTCGYSRVKVFRGIVSVRNLNTRRTVTLRAKRAYIVRTR
jgi:uncharacterized delta-60 repeat protein